MGVEVGAIGRDNILRKLSSTPGYDASCTIQSETSVNTDKRRDVAWRATGSIPREQKKKKNWYREKERKIPGLPHAHEQVDILVMTILVMGD